MSSFVESRAQQFDFLSSVTTGDLCQYLKHENAIFYDTGVVLPSRETTVCRMTNHFHVGTHIEH